MEFLKELDRGWQKVVDFKVGDNVTFSIPYFESEFRYNGIVLDIKTDYAVIEYYEPLNDLTLRTHVSLVDDKGYRRVTKTKGL